METLTKNEILCKVQTRASDVLKSLKLTMPMVKKPLWVDYNDYTDCFLINISDNKMTVTAFDGNETIIASQELEHQDGDIKVLVPGALLVSILSSLPSDEKISLNFYETKLIIVADEHEYEFPTRNPELFPEIKISTLVLQTTFPVEAIEKMVSLKYVLGKDEFKPGQMCVLMDFRPDGCEFVGTNGYMIHSYFNPDIKEQPIQVLINSKSIEVLKSLIQDEDKVIVRVLFNHIEFVFSDELKYIARRIDEKFPKIQSFFEIQPNYTVNLYRKTILTALERINIINVPDGNLHLKFEDNNLLIQANNNFNMNAKEMLELAEPVKESIDMCFGIENLIKLLKHIDSITITLNIQARNKPVVIHASEVEKLLIVAIMPLNEIFS